jgi:hypothetical protein
LNNDFINKNYEMNNKLVKDFLSVINSYLGMLKHHKSYKIRKKLLKEKINNHFWNYFYINNDYTVIKKSN